jgi:hypothetical protein
MSTVENKLEALKKLRDEQREQMTVLYQLRMSRQMKEDIFALLKSQNLELSFVLRNYIQTLLEENRLHKSGEEVSARLLTKIGESRGNHS